MSLKGTHASGTRLATFLLKYFAVWALGTGDRGRGGAKRTWEWQLELGDRAQATDQAAGAGPEVKDSEKKVGSDDRREREKDEETTQDTGWYGVRYVGGRGRRWMEILGPACKVGLFLGDAPCLAGSGPGWAAGGDEGCGHQSGYCARYLLAPGARRRRTTTLACLAAWTDPRGRDMEA